MITLTDGSQIEYHAPFSFPRHVYLKFKNEDKETLRRKCAGAYNETKRNHAEIKELRAEISDQETSNSPPDNVSVSQRSQVSQMTSSQSVMGGRNEQAQNRQNRRIAPVNTKRHMQSATPIVRNFAESPPNTAGNIECDTNADTCCLGKNFVVLQTTLRTANVYAYDASIQPIENVPIVTGATAYDDPVSGNTFILVFHESLFYGSKLDHSLINPNQVRAYGIPFWDNPYDPHHALTIEANDSVHIALQPLGTKLLFRTRVPTAFELQSCEHVIMTSPHLWNPSDVLMVQRIDQGGRTDYIPWKRQLSSASTQRHEYVDAQSDDALLDSVDPSLVNLGVQLCRQFRISEVDTSQDVGDAPTRRTFVSTERQVKVSAESLADKFGIGPKRAQRTIRVTTQRGVRSAILPISRRYYRADRIFGVKRPTGKFATDTAYGKIKSLRGNVGTQIYSHKCGFKAAYAIPKVDGNHVGDTPLTQFIGDFGVPQHLTFDGASVQTGPKTRFMDANRRYEIKYHVSGPRKPNENPAEQSMHEIKKRWYRTMLKNKVPPRLWDYGFAWACETENICANFSKHAEGRTPLEIVTGETPG